MKQILLCASLLMMLVSCSKSSSDGPTNDSMLRAGKWKTTAYTVRYSEGGVENVIDLMIKRDTCRTDDYIIFDSSYSGNQANGTLMCGSELANTPFEWSLKDNQKTLIFNNAQYTLGVAPIVGVNGLEYVEAKITKLSSKSLTITYDYEIDSVQVTTPTDPPVPYTIAHAHFYFTQVFTNSK